MVISNVMWTDRPTDQPTDRPTDRPTNRPKSVLQRCVDASKNRKKTQRYVGRQIGLKQSNNSCMFYFRYGKHIQQSMAETKLWPVRAFFNLHNKKYYLNMMALEKTLITRVKMAVPLQTRFGRASVYIIYTQCQFNLFHYL